MFEKFKEGLMKKIEENSYKQELSYIGKNGETITELVYLKRSKPWIIFELFKAGDWERIYPPVNEDGKLNLANFIFGGKKNIYRLLFYLLLIVLVGLAFNEIASQYEYLRNSLCVQTCIKGFRLG